MQISRRIPRILHYFEHFVNLLSFENISENTVCNKNQVNTNFFFTQFAIKCNPLQLLEKGEVNFGCILS